MQFAYWPKRSPRRALVYAPKSSQLVRESLGGFLLRMGNYAGAAELFRNDLDRNKRSGRSLFGLMESLKAQKKNSAAAQRKNSAAAQREFETAWKNADTKLTIADL